MLLIYLTLATYTKGKKGPKFFTKNLKKEKKKRDLINALHLCRLLLGVFWGEYLPTYLLVRRKKGGQNKTFS